MRLVEISAGIFLFLHGTLAVAVPLPQTTKARILGADAAESGRDRLVETILGVASPSPSSP